MLRFKKGDQYAFRMLYTSYKLKIINYCYRYCADREVAEELAQEVFLRVYNAAPKYKPQAKFSTWIFRIATNICLNERRSQKYKKNTESLDRPANTPAEGRPRELKAPMPLDSAERIEFKEKEDLIRQSILTLPKKQRAAVLLRVYYDFSYREISRQLNTSEGDVKVLIHRGRRHLKKALQAYMQDD